MDDSIFELALNLYVGSYFELSCSARFLGLVGVLEVLEDKRPSSQAAQQLVSKWKAEAKQVLDLVGGQAGGGRPGQRGSAAFTLASEDCGKAGGDTEGPPGHCRRDRGPRA
jgi:hypothetical protein